MIKSKKPKRLELFLTIGINSLILLVAGSFVGFYMLYEQLESVDKASLKRIKAILVADELGQTSESLTRLARNYVMTANPLYKRQYFDILKIRDGEMIRPNKTTSIYLDKLSSSGIKTVGNDGKPISLIQIAINEGINAHEVNILKQAKILSDLLAARETRAFEIIDTKSGKFNIHAAIDLVFNEEYEIKKSSIADAINDFHNSLNDRTKKDIAVEEAALNDIVFIMSLLFVMAIICCGFVIYIYQKINRNTSRAYQQIEEYSKTLKELNNSKNKFFSIIAHDLKSPFNGFLGLTELLAENINDLTNDEIQDFSKSLQKSANNLYELLDNLLEWANLENGITAFKPEKLDVHNFADKNIELHQDLASKKQIAISNKITQGTYVFTDKRMLNIILRNLVSNAIKFTPQRGKIEIGISQDNIIANFCTIYVKDSGLGMSEKILNNIFKINSKTSELGTEGEKGTGLGLILCENFVKRNGGRIWIESQVGQGSTFFFTLPLPK